MGVYSCQAFPLDRCDFGIFTLLSGAQQLFFLGGIAIAAGILTYSKKVMQTVGTNLLELSSEAAFVVVLSQALVLFIFSSSSLSGLMVRIGLPPIPLVPVSSTQVVVGSVLGNRSLQGSQQHQPESARKHRLRMGHNPRCCRSTCFPPPLLRKNIFGIDVGHSVNPPACRRRGVSMATIIRYSIPALL
jgi:inorganic phosphate transporter, PiT family